MVNIVYNTFVIRKSKCFFFFNLLFQYTIQHQHWEKEIICNSLYFSLIPMEVRYIPICSISWYRLLDKHYKEVYRFCFFDFLISIKHATFHHLILLLKVTYRYKVTVLREYKRRHSHWVYYNGRHKREI